MRHVAVLAVPPVKPFDLSMPALLLGAATVDGSPGYAVEVCTPEPGVVPANGGGFDVVIPHGLSALDTADTVIVPSTGSYLDADPRALAALRGAAAAGKRIMSICSGAFVLAQAGLLDGREATTHWAFADELGRAFPNVRVRPDVLYLTDGPVTTAAGSSAGIDLCLHVIRLDHGAAVANTVARAAVVTPVRAGGQTQYVDTPLPDDTPTDLAGTRLWALANLDRPLSLADLAANAHVSVRTLTRVFHAETGLSPQRWLARQRIERAKELLETTRLTVDQIARGCGLGSAESLRQHLHRQIGLSPSAYRAGFTRLP